MGGLVCPHSRRAATPRKGESAELPALDACQGLVPFPSLPPATSVTSQRRRHNRVTPMVPIPDIPPPSQQLHPSEAPDAQTHLGSTRNVCVTQQHIRALPTFVHLFQTLSHVELHLPPTATNRDYSFRAIITTPRSLCVTLPEPLRPRRSYSLSFLGRRRSGDSAALPVERPE